MPLKTLKPILFILLGIGIALSPELLALARNWRETGDANLIVLLNLVTWPIGAIFGAFGLVKLLQLKRAVGHVATAGDTAASVGLILGGLFLGSQAWSTFVIGEDIGSFLAAGFICAGAVACLSAGVRKALSQKESGTM